MSNNEAARFRFCISLAMASLACAEHFRQSGPNGLKLEKETTHVIVRWTQVDGVTLHDGTPRSRVLDVLHEVMSTHFQVLRHGAARADRQRLVAAPLQSHGFGHWGSKTPRVRRVDK